MIAELTFPESQAPSADKINRLEAEIMRLPRADIEIIHHFAPGTYVREMRAPAGSVITGKRHRTRHLNIVAKGRLTVYNELGDLREISAPFVYMSDAGTRRAAIVHEDLVWLTVHATDETDVAKLEATLVEEPNNPLIANLTQPCPSLQ